MLTDSRGVGRDTATYLLSIALFAGSYLYLIEALKAPAYALLALGLAGFAILGLRREGDLQEVLPPRTPLIIACAFWYASIFAAIWNTDLEIAAGATYVFAFFLAAYSAMRRSGALEAATRAFILTSAAVVAASLAVQLPSLGGSYQGVFDNPNALGGVLATFAAVLIARGMRANGRKWSMYVLAIAFITILTLLTRNRSAIGAVLACLGIVLILWLPSVTTRVRSMVLLLVALAASPFLFQPIWDAVVLPVVDKIQYNASAQGGITSGRADIWSAYLEQSALMGRGRDVLDRFVHAPHNTYVSLIAQFGWIAGLLFLGLVLHLVAQGWLLRKRVADGYLAVMSALTFLILSMTEGMLMKSTMFTMLIFACSPLTVSKARTDTTTFPGNAMRYTKVRRSAMTHHVPRTESMGT